MESIAPASNVNALVKSTRAPFTLTDVMVTVFVPVFFRSNVAVVVVKDTSVIVTDDDPMNPTVKAPIHAATAMLTATVTAMSMIEATTGLRAFLLRLNFFIFSFIPPLGLVSMVERSANLNLTTCYTILPICKTHLHKKGKTRSERHVRERRKRSCATVKR
jgi:hypothetical protein